jgi:hypothetical protein
MNDVVVADLSVAEVVAGLLNNKPDNWEREAAHRLLAEHGIWPGDATFRKYMIGWRRPDGTIMVAIRWGDVADDYKAGRIAASGEDALVLKAALSHVALVEMGLWEIENVEPRTMRAIMRAQATGAGYGDVVDEWCPLDEQDR